MAISNVLQLLGDCVGADYVCHVMIIHFTQKILENVVSFLIYAYGFSQHHMIGAIECLYSFAIIMYRTYSRFFKEENFHKFHKSIAIHENFALEMFAENILSVAKLS